MLVTDRKVDTSFNNTNFQKFPSKIDLTTELTVPIFCNYCKKESSNGKLCGRCKQVRYCSSRCQRADGESHVLNCMLAIITKLQNHKKIGSEVFGVNIPEKSSPAESKASKVYGIVFDEVMPVICYILKIKLSERKNEDILEIISKHEILGYVERVLILAEKKPIEAGKIFDQEAYDTSFKLIQDFFINKLVSEDKLSSNTDCLVLPMKNDDLDGYLNLLNETISDYVKEYYLSKNMKI